MTRTSRIVSATLALTIACLACTTVHAGNTLLIERTQARNELALPVAGQSMAQVEARFGAPQQRLDARGGQRRQWPTINRWVYPEFTVYFERERVINAVLNKASPQEVGPRSPVR